MPPPRRAYRPTVMGTRGAVASAHPMASMAGIQTLLAGGNAVDAAVAVGSTLHVVEPFMSSIGGIGPMLISPANRGGPRPGAVVTYKELAGTLRQVAEGGAEVFYRGPIAKAIVRAVQEAGGWLTEPDLGAFKAEWRQPATINYRGHDVYTMPPPFSA